MFALWWVFVPAAAARLWRPLPALVLALGALVQLLALGVDPQRLYLQLGIPENYCVDHPWLGFHSDVSHLLQRPREIREIVACTTRSPEFSPGPTPTCAPTLPSGFPVVVASTVALPASPPGFGPLSAVAALPMRTPVHNRAHPQAAVRQYHIYAALRPWWLSQQYLTPAERPVDLPGTLLLLAGLGACGLVVMATACWWGRKGTEPDAAVRALHPRSGVCQLPAETFQTPAEKTPAAGKNLT